MDLDDEKQKLERQKKALRDSQIRIDNLRKIHKKQVKKSMQNTGDGEYTEYVTIDGETIVNHVIQ